MCQVICLLLAPQGCPSSRYGVYNLIPYLKDDGVEVIPLPFYSEEVYEGLPRIGRIGKALRIASGILKRMAQSKAIRHADVIWIHRFAAPIATGLVATAIKTLGHPLIFSYDDAVYLRRGKPNLARHWFGSWRSIDLTLARSDVVLAWNHELERHARQYGKRTRMLPATIDVSYYDQVLNNTSQRSDKSHFVLGWIGTPSSAPYLQIIKPVLARLAQEGPIELRVIGGEIADIPGVTVTKVTWRQETEVQELCQADVGIAPMSDDPWTRGKSGLKVIQYMGCGLPVVASAVGSHLDIITDGVQGFLVDSEDAWLRALRALRDSESLRSKMSRAGRDTVHQRHDFSIVARAIADVCKQLC